MILVDIDFGIHSQGILWWACVGEFRGCSGGEPSFANIGRRVNMSGTSMATFLRIIEDKVDNKF